MAYPHTVLSHNQVPFLYPADLLQAYGDLANDETRTSTQVVTSGRVRAVRDHKELMFVDIESGGDMLQVKVESSTYDRSNALSLAQLRLDLKTGSWWCFQGHPHRTKRGQLSLAATLVRELARCHVDFPATLTDRETRHRNRPLDLAVNLESRDVLVKRSAIIAQVRAFCTNTLGLVEVETPMLQQQAGGASARPFATHHHDLDMPMQMRVAPELYLKMLVIGGMSPGVFEIGKNFRNESIDATHNPEFTAIELYRANWDYHDLMAMTEQLLLSVVKAAGYADGILEHQSVQGPVKLDFTQKFQRFSVVDELQREWDQMPLLWGEKLGDWDPFPHTDKLHTEEALHFFVAWCERLKLHVSPPQSIARVLDKLIGHFIEPRCIQPTFIIDHPQVMCPLAKWHRNRPGLTERFELFIDGLEYCNAYTELNDPTVQRDEFRKQFAAANGDPEAQLPDEDFCRALDLGLPPTAGWGMGIDRLVMLLTKRSTIGDAIAFPAMRPLKNQPVFTEAERKVISYHARYQQDLLEPDAIKASPAPPGFPSLPDTLPDGVHPGGAKESPLLHENSWVAYPTITIRRETKNAWEGRCALSPDHVRQLIASGIAVRVQRSPTRAYTDGEYERAGALLIDELSDRDIVIVGLKELPVAHMRANRTYLCFSHTFKGQPAGAYRIHAMARHNITLIDYELIRDKKAFAADPNTQARAMKFGPYAGIGGLFDTFHHLGLRLLDRHIRTPFLHVETAYGLPSLEGHGYPRLREVGEMIKQNGLPDELLPFTTVFISRGAVAENALAAFKHMAPVEVRPDELATLKDRPIEEQRHTLYYAVLTHEHLVERTDGKPFDKDAYYEDGRRGLALQTHRPIFAQRYLPHVSVIINGAYWNTSFPRHVSLEDAAKYGDRLLALGDLGCDIRGPYEFFSHSTRIRDPVYFYDTKTREEHTRRDDPSPHSVMVYGVDHIPGELAKDATNYFGNLFLPYVREVALHDQRIPYAQIKDLSPELLNAMQTRHGAIVGRYAATVKEAIANAKIVPSAEQDAGDLCD